VGSVDWGIEYRPSALQQSIEGICFGGVLFLLPFCATAVYATSQVMEITSCYIDFKIARCSLARYGWGKLLATALSSGLVLTFVYAIHACIWNLVSLPYDPVAYPYHELPFRDGTLFAGWHKVSHALPIYLYMTMGIGVYGAIWAVCSLAVAVWIPDPLLTVTIPVCIHKFWSGGFFRYAFGWQAPFPVDLFAEDVSPTQLFHTLAMYGVVLAIAVSLYFWGLKRRVRHE
jgi:hypothetical protein